MSVADIPAAPPATGFARRHAWLAVLVVGAALFIAEERTLVATQNPNLVPSAILLGASIVPLAFVTFVYEGISKPPGRAGARARRFETMLLAGRRLPYRVPGIAVAASAFLGGVIGTIVAATRRRREILQFVGAFVVAVVLHTLWDSQNSLIGTAVVAVASLGLLAFTAHRAAGQADPAL